MVLGWRAALKGPVNIRLRVENRTARVRLENTIRDKRKTHIAEMHILHIDAVYTIYKYVTIT